MSDKDFKKLTDLAKAKLSAGISKDDALRSFVFAGILKQNGEFTKPYKDLGSIIVDSQ